VRTRIGIPGLVLVLFAASGCNTQLDHQAQGQPDRKCHAPNPRLAHARLATAEVEPLAAEAGGHVQVGVAIRDASATVVGFCVPEGAFAGPTPSLVDGTRELFSFGGMVLQSTTGNVDYAFYPPTRNRHLLLVSQSVTLARLVFPPIRQRVCRTRVRPPFYVESCGMLLDMRWRTPITSKRAEGISLIDATVRAADSGTDLGFYILGLSTAGPMLTIRVA
jgi:hypothetical protein